MICLPVRLRRALVAGAVSGILGSIGAAPSPALADTATPAPLPNATSPGCLPRPLTMFPGVPWAQQQLAPQRVWPITNGAGVTVAVVDTGVDGQTPQLGGRVLAGQDLTGPGGKAGNTDCYGHGTFVSGIIGAEQAAGTGFSGVAPGVTILPIRVATSAEGGSPDVMAAGIRQAVAAGAKVINVSASTHDANANLTAAIADAVAHDVLVVAAAGNDERNGDPQPYPASCPGALAVGAVDSTGGRADFSQTGSYLGLAAPGVNIVSIGPGGAGHWQASGTSYAAPFVSGVAALVRAYRPELTAAQVVHRLEATAIHPPAVLPDPGLGWGTVDPLAAVTAVLSEEHPGGTTVLTPPAARMARATDDHRGPVVVTVAVFAAAGIAALALLVTRMGRTGQRRRWRPARVQRFARDTE